MLSSFNRLIVSKVSDEIALNTLKVVREQKVNIANTLNQEMAECLLAVDDQNFEILENAINDFGWNEINKGN